MDGGSHSTHCLHSVCHEMLGSKIRETRIRPRPWPLLLLGLFSWFLNQGIYHGLDCSSSSSCVYISIHWKGIWDELGFPWLSNIFTRCFDFELSKLPASPGVRHYDDNDDNRIRHQPILLWERVIFNWGINTYLEISTHSDVNACVKHSSCWFFYNVVLLFVDCTLEPGQVKLCHCYHDICHEDIFINQVLLPV